MATPFPFARPPAHLTADGLLCGLDLIASFEHDVPLRETLARFVERLQRIFGASVVAGLILDGPRDRPLLGANGPRAIAKAVAALREALPTLELTVIAREDGIVLGDERVLLEELARVSATAGCAWAEVLADGRHVVLVLPVPEDGGPVEATHAALQTLTAALFERRRAAGELRERVRRVATLYTVLEEIASNLDVDRVLTTIVERARDLLGCDCAYLSEVDETTRWVTMRATAGIRDAGYKQSTSELGQTLFGAVATTRHVMSTSDYLADPRFIHTPVTDANVFREGLKGIIAAPLLVGDRVLGVLGVANRGRIDCSPDNLDLVRSLADGAAIALENARLYSEQRKLVDQLRELNALTSNQHEALKRSVFVHDQLTELVLQGHALPVIAQRLAMLIANPVVVLGPHHTVLATAAIDASDARTVAAMLASHRELPGGGTDCARMTAGRRPVRLCPATTGPAPFAQIVAPVIVGAELLAYVVIVERDAAFDELDVQTLEQASTVFALELTRTRVIAEVEHRLRGDFVHDLLLGEFDPRVVESRATRLGHDLSRPQVVLAAVPDPARAPDPDLTDAQALEQTRRLERALRSSVHRRVGTAQTSIIGDVVVALLALPPDRRRSRPDASQLAQSIHDDVSSTLHPTTVSLGVSAVCTAPANLRQAYGEARLALRTSQGFRVRGQVASFDGLGIERILSLVPDADDLRRYSDQVLGTLSAYDAERGTQLLATLDTYLRTGARQRETARALGIHVNTLDYRLRRIAEIGGIALDDPEVRLDAGLALRVRRMLGPTEPRA